MPQPTQHSAFRQAVFSAIAKLAQEATAPITDATPLIGDGSVLDSMRLVELCLSLEDLAGEHGFEFDWTSEAAMSRSRSIFRTAGALADDFVRQSQGAA
jgi:acyl carrier protein